MSKFVQGTVIVMKTTDEPCMVLESFNSTPAFKGMSGDMVTVRRPVISQNGLSYIVESFHAEEFLTQSERRQQRIEEMSGDAIAIGLPSTQH